MSNTITIDNMKYTPSIIQRMEREAARMYAQDQKHQMQIARLEGAKRTLEAERDAARKQLRSQTLFEMVAGQDVADAIYAKYQAVEAERAALVTALEQEKESRRLREDEITEFEERYKLRWMERDAACRARDQFKAERDDLLKALREWAEAQTAWLAAEKDDLDLGAEMIEAEVRMIAAEVQLYKTYSAALAAVRGDQVQE